MRFVFNENQILRLKKKLSKEKINEDFLDDLISKGSSGLDKGATTSKDFIAGLDNEVDVVKKSQDVSSKADYIGDNVDDFYKILQDVKEPITQQKYGSMTHQQSVEAVQIGLQILGYPLPRFGTDGLFGPETAKAVKKYKQDKNIINESYIPGIDEMVWNKMPWGIDAGNKQPGIKWSGHETHIHFGFTNAEVAVKVIEKAKELGLHAGENPYSAKVHPVHVDDSHHYKTFNQTINGKKVGGGLDVSGDPKKMEELFNWVSTTLGNGESVTMDTFYVGGDDNIEMETITPEMVEKLIEDLLAKNITSEDLKKHIDPAVTTGGSLEFTDLDLTNNEGVNAYKAICDNYIRQRNPNAFVTGAMMAESAKRAYQRYRKYIPPELALSQLTLEGGISKDTSNRPIRTKNPFNVGNTPTKSNPQASFEDGVNLYYDLIARRYMVNGKTANDLINDFKNDDGNAYADVGYEQGLRALVKDIRRKNESVYAAIKSKQQSALAEELLNEADKRQAIKNAFRVSQDWADEFHRLSDKLSIWIADTFIKKMVESYGNQTPAGDDPRNFILGLFGESTPSDRGIFGRFWHENYKPKYEYILHWIRAPRREQLNIRELSFDQAYVMAQEWHESLETKKETNFKEDGDVFIDYRNADGIGYYWVHLHKNYCSSEADRMGHCARSNSGELISFRRINEFGEGESHLTVDYRPGGVIGDFHRHGNNKPTARFHKQIIDFLINQTYPVTQLTRSGVHRYEDNFQLSDLSEENLRRVFNGNPNLRYNINDESTWPEIINAILAGELSLANYGAEVIIRLIKKSEELGKFDEFKEKVTDDIIQDITGVFDNIQTSDKKYFLSKFANEVVRILTSVLDRGEEMTTEDFITSLRSISKNYFDFYETFCPFIDRGFKRFNEEERTEIASQRGIKRTLFSCTDSLPILARFTDNSPVDPNGNIAVKTEENLWGLIKQNGEVILHPQFSGISLNKIDTSGKTYIVKNLQNIFYKYNYETGDYTKFSMKG